MKHTKADVVPGAIAHRVDDREQTIEEHLEQTARQAERFAASFGKEKRAWMAGRLHDIGKYSPDFQEHIRHPEKTGTCDHSTAGAKEAFGRGQLEVAVSIMGHHGGLPNFGSPIVDTSGDGTFCGRKRKWEEGKIPDYSAWKSCGAQQDFGNVEPVDGTRTAFGRYMEIKMLHSALVDADYLDTERFMQDGAVLRGQYDTIGQLRERLENWLAGEKWLEAQGGVNGMRAEILQAAAAQGKKQGRGIYTLTVPTGGGKTVSSLRFALHHAAEHGLDRIIYVVPYTNIIEQTAQKFRTILGEENVLEHHSNVVYEKADQEELNPFLLASENWDMPVVITTAVQFFESLFHNKPSRCRKIHNMANSVIIYDEVQMLPVDYWIPCVRALEELSGSYRATQVLCTATQPAITFPGGKQPEEIAGDVAGYFSGFKRVTFRDAGELELDRVAGRMAAQEQVLCVVNTKKAARDLYDMLAGGEDTFYLTTMMVPAHRQEVLKKIRDRLGAGKSCRLAATSLVEAGVDLDFAYVMRELAGLDSVLQAAGRCNREGKRSREESITEIFTFAGKIPHTIRQQADAARRVMAGSDQWDSLEAIEAYFTFWRQQRGGQNLDKKGIMEKVEQYAFRDIAEAFRLIESDTYTIYVPWGEEGESLVGRLRAGEYNRSLLRKLGRYGVNVFQSHYVSLLQGDAETVNGLAVLTNMSLYRAQTGLEFEEKEGIAIFS